MQVKRFNIDAQAARRLYQVAGLPVVSKEEYGLSVILAGLVRSLLNTEHGSTRIVVSAQAIREVAERGAWFEIVEDGENLIVQTTLK